MLSSEEQNGRYPSSRPFQSAQQPADQVYAENANSDLASDYLSDTPSLEQSSQRHHQSAAEDEHQESREEDSQESRSLPSRPNRFRGPPSTWRNWTAPERDLAASLDQLQAEDLSVHLYNSFKLGQRNRTRDPGRRNHISEHSKDTNEGPKWTPPRVWTAWPLPPAIVPRKHDEKCWEEGDVLPLPYHSSQRRPGHYLQEMLVAHVLRKAKERFHDRQWEGAPQSTATTTSRGRQSQIRGGSSKKRLNAKEDPESPDQKPVVMADDERASEILQATVQHIMTKLDDLLMGLHKARSAYLLVQEPDMEFQSQSSERSTSRGRPRKRKREAPKSDEDTESGPKTPNPPVSDSDEERASEKKSSSKGKSRHPRCSSRRSRSQNFHSRKGRLGLRDWNDVLGIASMTGWHQNVVGNATARCATLFGEGIKLRTLEEGKPIQEEHCYLPNASPLASGEFSQGSTWRAREGSSSRSEGEMVGGVHVDGFLKPIEGKKSWMYSKDKKRSKGKQPSRRSRG